MDADLQETCSSAILILLDAAERMSVRWTTSPTAEGEGAMDVDEEDEFDVTADETEEEEGGGWQSDDTTDDPGEALECSEAEEASDEDPMASDNDDDPEDDEEDGGDLLVASAFATNRLLSHISLEAYEPQALDADLLADHKREMHRLMYLAASVQAFKLRCTWLDDRRAEVAVAICGLISRSIREGRVMLWDEWMQTLDKRVYSAYLAR